MRPLPPERYLLGLPPEQLAEMIGRKDAFRDRANECAHRAWALAWLAVHASDSGKITYDEEHYQDALYIVLDEVVRVIGEARAELEGYTGVYYQVTHGAREPAP